MSRSAAGATIVCNLSASNFTVGKAELRRLLARSVADRGKCAYVYVAGLEPMRDQLDTVFSELAGSRERWLRRKAELMAGKRWVELLY